MRVLLLVRISLWYIVIAAIAVCGDHGQTKGQAHTSPSTNCVLDVTDFGAVGDGQEEDTLSIRHTLEKARSDLLEYPGNAPIVIYFPPNKTFVSAPLNLSSNLILHVEGTLQAITNATQDFENKWPKLPPHPSYGDSRDQLHYLQYQSFLFARDASHIIIQGSGTIHGMGSWWWDAFLHDSSTLLAGRPNLMQFWNCSHVEVTGVTLQDAPFWTVHPIYSQQIHIHHMTIRAPMYAPNVDGIDPDSCQDVLIEYNDISCGDDHIAIKAGVCGSGSDRKDPIACADDIRFSNGSYTTRNVTIRYNTMRIGMGIALGSELSGGIEDVAVYQNVIGLCEHGHEDASKSCGWGHALHLKTTLTRGGFLRNIQFHTNTIYNNTGFLLVETDYQDSSHILPPSNYLTTEIRNLSVRSNSGMAHAVSVAFLCSPYMTCQDVHVSDNWIRNAQPSNYQCSFVETYQVERNEPNGLEKCMYESMNRTEDTVSVED